MKITFLGVGEACDPDYPNTSLLVQAGAGHGHALLDCGFTTPHLYFKSGADARKLAVLWISHFHGDHFFGVPLLLLRLWEMERHGKLSVLGPAGVREKVTSALELSYPGFGERLGFAVDFVEVEPGLGVRAAGFTWRSALGEHTQRGLAVRIEDGDKSLFYSGDGRPTAETRELARGCDLVVHEAFRLAGETPGHGNLLGCLEFARAARIPRLALVHVQRHERDKLRQELERLRAAGLAADAFLPEPGETLVL